VSRESLVAALSDELWDEEGCAWIASAADRILPILLAHASPEARAAALRGLLVERVNTISDHIGRVNVADEWISGEAVVRALLPLAPTPPTGGTAE